MQRNRAQDKVDEKTKSEKMALEREVDGLQRARHEQDREIVRLQVRTLKFLMCKVWLSTQSCGALRLCRLLHRTSQSVRTCHVVQMAAKTAADGANKARTAAVIAQAQLARVTAENEHKNPDAARRRRRDRALDAAGSLHTPHFDKTRLAMRLEEREDRTTTSGKLRHPRRSRSTAGIGGGQPASRSGSPERSASATPQTAGTQHSEESEFNYRWDNYQSLHAFDLEIQAATGDKTKATSNVVGTALEQLSLKRGASNNNTATASLPEIPGADLYC
eukprot:SAG31_NODE_296_length_18227_cov_39.663173_12_plen_276_part_00